jgi:hypothetical protein
MASNDNVTILEAECAIAQKKTQRWLASGDSNCHGFQVSYLTITPSVPFSSLIEKIPHTHIDALPEADQSLRLYFAKHDGKVHDPLGAGSYIFERQYVPSLMRYIYMGLPLEGKEFLNRTSRLATTTIVHIGAQPNNSPHAGTIIVIVPAFLIAPKSSIENLGHGLFPKNSGFG